MRKTNLEKRKIAERQARYWKRCAERQKEEIKWLEEELEKGELLKKLENVLISSVLVEAGADAEHPVDVKRETLNAAVRYEFRTSVVLTEDGYKLHWVTCGQR